jgi:hypothetical protein
MENTVMKMTKYRGYLIARQKEFGSLRLLKWVEDGDFIIVKDNANAMPGATFRTEGDAKKVIDIQVEAFRAFASGQLGTS